ncbi:ninjurin-1-like [Anopheles merus]|nr:ninjurin-1-like [Anopheles merus]
MIVSMAEPPHGSAQNTNDSLIAMNAQAEPGVTDLVEMRRLEPLELGYAEDGTASVSEVDGRRKTRASQTQTYDIHKGIAESAMDISLLTANANQLRLLMTYNEKSHTYVACIALVISSLVLQIFVASGVIIIKSYPRSKPNRRIHKLKVCTSILVSIITVINILVASLVITDK